MKLIELLTLALLSLSCFAAKKSSLGTFESYHAKSQASAPLKLDDAAYEELTATPRNHSVVVLLTALEARFGCQLCRDFQPEWDLLGKSWAKGDRKGDTRTLLGTLDFADGKGTFQKVGNVSICELPWGLVHGLISMSSLCCKPLLYSSYSHPPQDRMQNQTDSPFDMTLLRGKSVSKQSQSCG